MSKVYSFRLSEDNPREAQARRVIETWVNEGYSLRHVVVEALTLYKQDRKTQNDNTILLQQLQDMIDGSNIIEDDTDTESSLSGSFLAGIKQGVQKGIKV